MPTIKAVVFYLYGTLIYLADKTRPYNRLFDDLMLTDEERLQARHLALSKDFGSLEDFANMIKPTHNLDMRVYEEELDQELASATLYRETRSVLGKLVKMNLKLGLISNLASPYKAPFFNLGLDIYFNQTLFSCKSGLIKPDISIFHNMLKSLNIRPRESMMVGDSVHADIIPARDLGMKALHVDRTNPFPDSISSLDEIFSHL
jgi:putative hydrolase of the HAD superfamily